MGVRLTGCVFLGRAFHWACTSLDVYLIDVYLMGMHLMGVVCVEAFRIFNLGVLGKCPYPPTMVRVGSDQADQEDSGR
jgi:hypothetical protein